MRRRWRRRSRRTGIASPSSPSRRPASPSDSRGPALGPAHDLPQPGCEEPLDLAAAAWRLEPRLDDLPVDDDERRNAGHLESLRQVGPFLAVDAVELERRVV